jgi:hypothetical protein
LLMSASIHYWIDVQQVSARRYLAASCGRPEAS